MASDRIVQCLILKNGNRIGMTENGAMRHPNPEFGFICYDRRSGFARLTTRPVHHQYTASSSPANTKHLSNIQTAMSLRPRLLPQPASAPKMHSTRSLAPWRFWTALVTTVAFVLLLSTVSTHHHATTADDQDCAVCSVVSHKVTDLPEVVLPKLVLVLVSYAPLLVPGTCVARVSASLLPPSRGPPAIA